MDDQGFAVDDLVSYAQDCFGVLSDMGRLNEDYDSGVPCLDSDEVIHLKEAVDNLVHIVSGDGPFVRCVKSLAWKIQKTDGNTWNIAEFTPYRHNESPAVYIAPTAYAVASEMLRTLSWEFFDRDAGEIRTAFSKVAFDWLELRRLRARMEREASIVVESDAGLGEVNQSDDLPLLVGYADFTIITKRPRAMGGFDRGIPYSTLSKYLPAYATPHSRKNRRVWWEYETLAKAWNEQRPDHQVPSTDKEARACLCDPRRQALR